MIRLLDWIAAALVMGAMACAGASPILCATDAECDGGPMPAAYRAALECDRYDCGEG